jgi:Holliday junction resolvase
LSNYISGRNAEYTIKRMLISDGFRYVIRSAGSHTPVDLIATDGKTIVAVQVKKGSYISKDEKALFYEWGKAFGARPVLATKKEGRWVLTEVKLSSFA